MCQNCILIFLFFYSFSPSGASHIRVRLVPGLPGRLQTRDKPKLQNLQNPTTQFYTRGGTSRTSYLSFTPHNIPNTPVNIREYQPNNNQDLNPTAGGAGFTGSHRDPNSSGGSGSDLKIHTRSDCSSQYGASVHQGIMRGTQNRSLYIILCELLLV